MADTFDKVSDTFLSNDGEHQIAYTIYTPKTPPHAILQIAHGMTEHFGRYEEFASFLAEHGIVVCGNDHLGHGQSVKDETELGFFGEKGGMDYVVADMHSLRDILRRKYPKLPYILFGHSMGSFLARMYTVLYPTELDGAIYCGTSAGKEPLWLGKMLASLIGLFCGKRHRSKLIQKLAFGSYHKRFAGQQGNWLTKDMKILMRDKDDPRLGYNFTVAAHRDLFDLLMKVSSDEWAEKVPCNLPILLVSGSDDPVGAYSDGVRAVYERLKEAEVTDLTLKLYAGDRHEILNELDREQVFEDLLAWIEGVCNGVIAANGTHR